MDNIATNPLMLIGTAGDYYIHLIYGVEIGDRRPIILTVTPEYAAHKTSKPLPIHRSDFAHCLDDNAEDLRKIALDCRDRGKTSAILTGTSMKESERRSRFIIGSFDIEGILTACARYVRMLRGGQRSEERKTKAL